MTILQREALGVSQDGSAWLLQVPEYENSVVFFLPITSRNLTALYTASINTGVQV